MSNSRSTLRARLSRLLWAAVIGGGALLAVGLVRQQRPAAQASGDAALMSESEARRRAFAFLGTERPIRRTQLEWEGRSFLFTLDEHELVGVNRVTGAIDYWLAGMRTEREWKGEPGLRTGAEAEAVARRIAEKAIPDFKQRNFRVASLGNPTTSHCDVELEELLPNGAAHGRVTVTVPRQKKLAPVTSYRAFNLHPPQIVNVAITQAQAVQATMSAAGVTAWLREPKYLVRTMPDGGTRCFVSGYHQKEGHIWHVQAEFDAATGRMRSGSPQILEHPHAH